MFSINLKKGALLLLGGFLTLWLPAQQYSVDWNLPDSISSGGDTLASNYQVTGWETATSLNLSEDQELSSVEFSVPNDSVQKAIYLETATDVGGDFGFHFSNDLVYIVDDGTFSSAGLVTDYTDFMLVRTTGETVEFYLDGNLHQTSTAVLQGEVYVKADFHESSYVYNIKTNFQQTWAACWDEKQNLWFQANQTLVSNDVNGSWESGAISFQETSENLDDYIIFSQDSSLNGEAGIGLSTSHHDHDWTNIDYCFHLDLDLQEASVCTLGTVLHTIHNYTSTSYFRIERNAAAGTIDFIYDGVNVYSLSDPGGTYHYDVCYIDSGQALNGLRISLPCGQTSPGYYSVNGSGRKQGRAYFDGSIVKLAYFNPYNQSSGYLIYDLYNQDHELIASVDKTGSVTGGAPLVELSPGANFLDFDLSGVNDFSEGNNYSIVIYNAQGDRTNHFIYSNPN